MCNDGNSMIQTKYTMDFFLNDSFYYKVYFDDKLNFMKFLLSYFLSNMRHMETFLSGKRESISVNSIHFYSFNQDTRESRELLASAFLF